MKKMMIKNKHPGARRMHIMSTENLSKNSVGVLINYKKGKTKITVMQMRRDGGTIASVLFVSQPPQGYTPTGKGVQSRPKQRYNNSLDTLQAILRSPLGRQNTVTSLVAFIARYSLSWFGSLCRWAGVRGTIPQPIVVTAVFAMGISSRRGYRGLSVCLSLLALRMVGEFIHGSLHGNEFWEDEYSKESHEWTRE